MIFSINNREDLTSLFYLPCESDRPLNCSTDRRPTPRPPSTRPVSLHVACTVAPCAQILLLQTISASPSLACLHVGISSIRTQPPAFRTPSFCPLRALFLVVPHLFRPDGAGLPKERIKSIGDGCHLSYMPTSRFMSSSKLATIILRHALPPPRSILVCECSQVSQHLDYAVASPVRRSTITKTEAQRPISTGLLFTQDTLSLCM